MSTLVFAVYIAIKAIENKAMDNEPAENILDASLVVVVAVDPADEFDGGCPVKFVIAFVGFNNASIV